MKKTTVIEFFGMPKAGKSTQIDILETKLKRENGCRVRVVHEGARICPLDKKDRFLYHAWSLNSTVNRIIEAKDQNYDYVLIDRGIIDHIAFSYALLEADLITKQQMDRLVVYAKEFLWLEDKAIGCLIDSQESLTREGKYCEKNGRVINDQFLQLLRKSYDEIRYPELGIKAEILDLSKDINFNIQNIIKLALGN